MINLSGTPPTALDTRVDGLIDGHQRANAEVLAYIDELWEELEKKLPPPVEVVDVATPIAALRADVGAECAAIRADLVAVQYAVDADHREIVAELRRVDQTILGVIDSIPPPSPPPPPPPTCASLGAATVESVSKWHAALCNEIDRQTVHIEQQAATIDTLSFRLNVAVTAALIFALGSILYAVV